MDYETDRDFGDETEEMFHGLRCGPWIRLDPKDLFPPTVYRKYFKARKNHPEYVEVPDHGTIRVESVDGDSITYSVGPFTGTAKPPRPSRKPRSPRP